MNTPPILRDKIAQALSYDALGDAEKITGESYKTDKATESLGFLLHLEHVQNKRALLELAGDSHFAMSWADFKKLIARVGFVIQFTESFNDAEGRAEEAFCAWNAGRGALLWAESYGLGFKDYNYPPSVNSAKVYFNWRANKGENHFTLSHVSGGMTKKDENVFVLDFDAREGLVHQLTDIESKGRFEPRWTEAPFLWLLTYMDPKIEGYDHRAITKGRLAKLSPEIREAIRA